MSNIPIEHAEDAQKLQADGEIFLYEVSPSVGTGVVRFKADNTATWRGQVYEGLPLQFTGEAMSSQSGRSQPTLTIGDQQVDLLALKPFIYDGSLDGGSLTRLRVLRDDFENNRLIREAAYYKIKQIPQYGRYQIVFELAMLSDSLGFSLPFKQYYSPDFPMVQM